MRDIFKTTIYRILAVRYIIKLSTHLYNYSSFFHTFALASGIGVKYFYKKLF